MASCKHIVHQLSCLRPLLHIGQVLQRSPIRAFNRRICSLESSVRNSDTLPKHACLLSCQVQERSAWSYRSILLRLP